MVEFTFVFILVISAIVVFILHRFSLSLYVIYVHLLS